MNQLFSHRLARVAAAAADTIVAAAGSVTAAVSSPVTVSGTVAAPVSCVTGAGYRGTVSSAVTGSLSWNCGG